MIIALLTLSSLLIQDPPGPAVAPGVRSAEQAAVDVCLYTPPATRDPSCGPLLEAEAALVPAHALTGAGDALTWAGQVCPPGEYPVAAERAACRQDQRDRFRRAHRAREALNQGVAGGVYAEAHNAGPPATTASDETPANGFRESRRQIGDNCEQRSEARRDNDTGDQSSSHSVVCAWGNGDAEQRERARRLAIGEDRR